MLANREYRLLKRAREHGLLNASQLSVMDRITLRRLVKRGYLEPSKKTGEQQSGNPGEMFDKQAEEKRYRRYKHRCYRDLILKALLSFGLGLLFAFVFKSI